MKKSGFTFLERKLIYIDGAAAPQESQPVTPVAEVKPQPVLAPQPEKVPAQPEAQKAPEQVPASPDAAASINQQTKDTGNIRITRAHNNLDTLANITV